MHFCQKSKCPADIKKSENEGFAQFNHDDQPLGKMLRGKTGSGSNLK